MRKKDLYNNKSGVTLIVLSITIVVLIILAGVGIVSVFGDTGVIDKTNESKDAAEKADIKEEFEYRWLQLQNQVVKSKEYPTKSELADEFKDIILEEYPGAEIIEDNNTNEIIKIKYKNYEFEIKLN